MAPHINIGTKCNSLTQLAPHIVLTPALDAGEWFASRPERYNLWKSQVPTGEEAEWAPAPIWTLYIYLLD